MVASVINILKINVRYIFIFYAYCIISNLNGLNMTTIRLITRSQIDYSETCKTAKSKFWVILIRKMNCF